jgi:TRIAD3 protein (E3 ubiquitin-protein ligase RNF216)
LFFDTSDTDTDDGETMVQPPPPPPPPPLLLPQTIIALSRLTVSIPDVPRYLRAAYARARVIEPRLCSGRLSQFMAQVIASAKPVDNLVNRIIIISMDQTTPQSAKFRVEVGQFLQLAFPQIAAREINKHAQMGVAAAYRALERLESPKLLKVPRRPPPIARFNEVPLAIEILELFDHEEVARRSVIERQKRADDIERARSENALVECECCCEERPRGDFAHCATHHAFCRDCLLKYAETLVGEGRADVRCLHIGGCDAPVPLPELEAFLPPQTLARLFATESQNAVAAAGLQGIVACHKCGLRVVFEGSGNLRCPDCAAETCTGCGRLAHDGMTCEAFGRIDKDRIVEEKMNEAVVRICPKCNAQFIKEDGCNKMECPRCHAWICYWCRKEVPREVGYAHFWRAQGACPPDRCPLWVSNDVLHRLEAGDARERTRENLGDVRGERTAAVSVKYQ